MPGLDPNLVSHTLNIELGTKPVVQPRRNFHPEVEKQIKVEIEKLLAAGFIKPIKHPTWLANIVPVKKKTGVIRVCTDYRDLNRACPKDEFPLPNMDILIDSTSGQGMLSFMDGFSGYNQIKMSLKDAEKTAFRTPYGNFYYTVMPFGLKNAGATYQRAMTAVFHDMMRKEVEDYVDDLVVKSETRLGHQEVLRRVLERCRLYGLKMNPKKCAFGVSSGKFLGFQVHQRGIDVDPEKTRALKSLSPPKNPKELKSFMGRLSYIRRFIPGLAAMMSTFTPLLKKGQPYIWSKECQEAYQQVQQLIARLPTMRAPTPGFPLKLYLAATDTAVGALLAQDSREGEESPIYYVSRQLKGAETRYPKAELLCLALVYAAQRLRHYFLAHKLQLVVKSDPVRYLLTRPVLSGRLARWLLQLSEFDIVCTTPKAIRGQAVIDMLALFPEVEESTLSKEVLGELPEVVATVVEEAPWTLYFDGSSTTNGGGAGVVIINPEGKTSALSFKLDFPCTNNVAEYEAFIMGLSTAREMGAERVKIIGDSNLVLSQLQGSFAVKEATLAPYRTAAERLVNSFKQVVMEHIPGVTNRYADALATLGSKLSYVQEQPDITVVRRETPVVEAMVQEELLEEDDWRKPLRKEFSGESSIKDLKDYVLIFGELYRRLPGGVLTRCVGMVEARRRLQEVHDVTCSLEPVTSLYRRLQRKGYYWPEMRKQAADVQANCPKCSTVPTTEEAFTVSLAEDWRAPYLAFFVEGALPTDAKLAYKLKKTVKRYFMDGATLYRKGFNGEPLRCLERSEAHQVMQEIHAGECGEHQGMKRLYRQLLSFGYYWPTMKKDAHDFVKKCHTCQIHANLSHKPPTLLQDMRTPWPFHTWGLDLIGTIHPPSDGYIWILTATEYFTKWVEAIPLRKATGAAVSNFIREYIVCRFGIPYKMVTDNGTPFVNKQVSSTLNGYGIKHRRSTPYYPQGNGQAEATNKTILRILSKMVYEYKGNWSIHLPDGLWAYRTSPRGATGFSPYSLVYGSDAISPVEITIPTARVSTVNDLEWDAKSCSDWRVLDLEAVDEKRMEAERKMALYHRTTAQAYNRTVKPQAFKQGDLVLKVVEHVRRQISGPSKFAPQWEGPFAVKGVHSSGYYHLISVKEGTLTDPINGNGSSPTIAKKK
ncbi:hypothetical protein L3X38_017246 [Prunus dulcis]|uniref:Uncharacterized protein n=1 Tax=Prunus dulcis TaxID=3755 RepID=A0AAD4Z9L4_PRUDU|nr:hypothetical protein L3X38_017246 [Prunus dulcis]